MEPKNVVLDLLAHRIDFKTFKKLCKNNPEIVDWIQSIVPSDRKWRKLVEDEEVKKRLNDIRNGSPASTEEFIELMRKSHYTVPIPYDVRVVFSDLNQGRDELGHWLNVHHELISLMRAAFPNETIEINDYVDRVFNFVISVCPEYIGGPEVDELNILENTYNELPDGSETARKKAFKEKLKTLFHVQGSKFPRWFQNPEWPMGKNSPMRFVSQSHKGEIFKYMFEDVDTGEQKTVIQFS